MNLKKKTLVSALLISSISPVISFAHGALSYPESRQWMCSSGATPNKSTPWNGGDNPACKAVANAGQQQIFTDWSSMAQGAAGGKISKWGENTLQAHKEAIGTGGVCSGGNSKYEGLNSTTYNWESQATTINVNDQQKQFTYAVSAPHKTYGDGYIDVYITNSNWKPGQKVTFDDLDPTPICHYKSISGGVSPLQTGYTTSGEKSNFEDFTCEIPKTTSPGKHVLFTIWQRNDSDEAFYSCSDVNIENGTPIETVWNSFPSTEGTTTLPTYSPLHVGDKIIFNSTINGQKHDTSITITDDNMSTWQYTLATQINNLSTDMQAGIKSSNDKIKPDNSNNNSIYIKNTVATENSSWNVGIEYIDPPTPISNTYESVNATGRDSNVLYDIKTLKVGDTITFRLFNNKQNIYTGLRSGSSDVDSIKLDITSTNIDNWKYNLATKFNDTATSKDKISIGVLNQDQVKPVNNNTAENAVYLLSSNKTEGDNYSWTIDVSSPEPTPTGDYDYVYPDGIGSYSSGTKVKGSDGNIYTCKEGVATWCNQSAYDPSGHYSSSAWENNSTPTEPTTDGTWSSSKIYNGGETVVIDNITYQAQWWNQNKNPKNNYGAYGKPWKKITHQGN